MNSKIDDDLSTGESAIYDRQIRLWGSNAQLRIKSSKVLFIGLSTGTVEIVKNTVLAGANIILEDPRLVDAKSTNFLIQLEIDDPEGMHRVISAIISLGMSVAEATAFSLHRLNEHPSVEFRTSSSSEQQLDTSIAAVVVSLSYLDFDIDKALSISREARAKGIAFFAVVDSWNVSWMFSDFGASHIVEAHTPPLRRDDRTGDRTSTSNGIEEYEFCDFHSYIGAPVNDKYWNSKPSFPSEVFLFVYFYLRFRSSKSLVEDKDPSPKRIRRAATTFSQYLQDTLTETPSGRFSKYLGSRSVAEFCSYLASQYEAHIQQPAPPHIAAILGALVTQEIIKYVTKKDPPLVNSLVIHNEECSAVVVKQPPSLPSRIISSTTDAIEENDIEIVTTAASMVEAVLD